jgi:hypothetical protein
MFTSILASRLQPYAEEAIGKYQAGFRPGRATTDQLFTVRQINGKFWEHNLHLYEIFIDFCQACYSILRENCMKLCMHRIYYMENANSHTFHYTVSWVD